MRLGFALNPYGAKAPGRFRAKRRCKIIARIPVTRYGGLTNGDEGLRSPRAYDWEQVFRT